MMFMTRSAGLRWSLVLIESIPISLILFVVEERFKGQHNLGMPGIYAWRALYGRSVTSSPYLTGLWLELAVNALCCLILVVLILAAAHALIRAFRMKGRHFT
jgi:ABC-type maltose transport system permease subunit